MRTRLFVIMFFALMTLPLLQMRFGIFPDGAINENRSLAASPALSMPLDHLGPAANNWFNDHFGLRPFLIKAKAQFDYIVFGTSDRVHIGKDGWLFYRSVIDVEEPNVEAFLAKNEQQVLRGIQEFSNALQSMGIRTIMFVPMMSDRFYGDKLPRSAPRRPARPLIDEFVSKLETFPNVTFIDSKTILRETMLKRQVFHKTDFHWNNPAAFEVAKKIVDSISLVEGLPKSAWTHQLSTEEVRYSGGIATFMPLFTPPSELTLSLKSNYALPPGTSIQNHRKPFEEIVTIPDSFAPLPPVLLVGDSFLDGVMLSGLPRYFSKTSRIRWGGVTKISEIARVIPPDTKWVVVEFIEVSMACLTAFADRDDVRKAIQILQENRLQKAP